MFELLFLALIAFALAGSSYRIFRLLRDRSVERATGAGAAASRAATAPRTRAAPEPPLSFFGVAALTLTNRALILLIAHLAYQGIADQRVSFVAPFQEIWGKWDARSYLEIAETGYRSEGERRYLLVYYPLYPLAIRLVSYVVGDYFWAAIAVSLASLIAATYFLYRLVWLEFSDAALARESVKYLLIFPFSFLFSAAFTESLFLLLSVLAFYFCRRERWLAAGLAGLLAALTRNHGVLLVIPLLIELVCRSRFSRDRVPELIRRAACVGLVLVGFGIYLGMNKWVSGDWFTFVRYQSENWHNALGLFSTNVGAGLDLSFQSAIRMVLGTWLPQFVLFFAAAAFLAASTRKIAPSYLLYSIAYLVLSYSPVWLLSESRYVAAMFPLFICMALFARGSSLRQHFLDATSYLLLGLYVSMYPQTLTIY